MTTMTDAEILERARRKTGGQRWVKPGTREYALLQRAFAGYHFAGMAGPEMWRLLTEYVHPGIDTSWIRHLPRNDLDRALELLLSEKPKRAPRPKTFKVRPRRW